MAVGPLQWVPIHGEVGGPDAELLNEALPTGRTSVSEVSAEGVVAWVRVQHGGTRPLLIVDGEHVVGAKQNRIFNASFLVAPGQTVDLPVTCVERRRWSYKSTSFKADDATISSKIRAMKLGMLGASLGRGGGHHCDQQVVWREVDRYLAQTGTDSQSAAFGDGFQSRRAGTERSLDLLEPRPGQVGVAAVREGAIVGMDIFGSASLYGRGWKKVARGLLAEVYREAEVSKGDEALKLVKRALEVVATTAPTRTAAPGIGETLHVTAQDLTFACISADDVLFHGVCAPSVEDGSAAHP